MIEMLFTLMAETQKLGYKIVKIILNPIIFFDLITIKTLCGIPIIFDIKCKGINIEFGSV